MQNVISVKVHHTAAAYAATLHPTLWRMRSAWHRAGHPTDVGTVTTLMISWVGPRPVKIGSVMSTWIAAYSAMISGDDSALCRCMLPSRWADPTKPCPMR